MNLLGLLRCKLRGHKWGKPKMLSDVYAKSCSRCGFIKIVIKRRK